MSATIISAAASGDLFGFEPASVDRSVKHFVSGALSSPAIFEGFKQAGSPLCIVASSMGPKTLERAVTFACKGGELLVDSGAFLFRKEPDRMPWAKVVKVYKALAACKGARLTFVLADVVGSQQGSLAALSDWGVRLQQVIGAEHHTLLPLQNGDLSPEAYTQAALSCLIMPISGVAIPCNAAAFKVELLSSMYRLPDCVPRRVHFLGISRGGTELRSRILRLHKAWPDADISCDSAAFRAQLGVGKPITEARRSALADLVETEIDGWDDTEEDEEFVLAALRDAHPTMDGEQLQMMASSQVGAWASLQIAADRFNKEKGTQATTAAIGAFANELQGRT